MNKVIKSFIIYLPLGLYLSVNTLAAQSVKDSSKAKIVLNSKAKIYSSDGAFNKQIVNNRIIHDGADVSHTANASGTKIMKIVSTKENISYSNLQSLSKNLSEKDSASKNNRQVEVVEKDKKKILLQRRN